VIRVAALAVVVLSMPGCKDAPASTCGASVRVAGVKGHRVSLYVENVSDDTIEIGSTSQATFVDKDGAAMEAEMRPGEDDWFMAFKLPARSHRTVTVTLKGGDPATLARLEIPNSGNGFVPDCTISVSDLSH
jgi:hypothetical protein